GLVEARLQLHEYRDLHAALGSLDQAPRDRAVTRRAVERHLDRLHAWIVRRFFEKRFDRAGRRFVRVMHEQRSLTDHREQAAARFLGPLDASRGHWWPRHVLELRPVERVGREQTRQVEQLAMMRDGAAVELELAKEEVEHLIAHRRVDLEADRATEAA